MDKHSKKAFSDEPAAALRKWKAAMARFDAAAPDEAKIVALEVEAARRRYIFLLEQRRTELLNAGSRLGLRFFCLFPPVTDAAIVRTPRLKSTGKDTLFMAPQILTFIIVLAVIFIIFKIFNLSIKIFFKLLINALIGAALLFVFNFVFAGLLNLSFFYINITWLTALITGIFGVPGVVVLLIIGLL